MERGGGRRGRRNIFPGRLQMLALPSLGAMVAFYTEYKGILNCLQITYLLLDITIDKITHGVMEWLKQWFAVHCSRMLFRRHDFDADM